MDELTPLELNNTIVRMRHDVEKAKARIIQRLVKQIQRFKKAHDEKKKQRVARLEQELNAVKRLKKDAVSKFALVNVKTFADFKTTNKTLPDEIALYKVATETSLSEKVDQFRKKYTNWHQEVPFILQRLGLKSQSKKPKSKGQLLELLGNQAEELLDENVKEAKVSKKAKPERPDLKKGDEIVKKLIEKFTENVDKPEKLKENKAKKRVATGPIEVPRPVIPDKIISGPAVIKKLKLHTDDDEKDFTAEASTPVPSEQSDENEEESESDLNESSDETTESESESEQSTKEHMATTSSFFLGSKVASDDDKDSNGKALDSDQDLSDVEEAPRKTTKRPQRGSFPLKQSSGAKPRSDRGVKNRTNFVKMSRNEPTRPKFGATRGDFFSMKTPILGPKPKPGVTKPQKSEEKLHPSWEAKKKLREKALVAAPQGKHMKFSEDSD